MEYDDEKIPKVDSFSLIEEIAIEAITYNFGGSIIKENGLTWSLNGVDKKIEIKGPCKVKKNNLLPNNRIVWLEYGLTGPVKHGIKGDSDIIVFVMMDSLIICKTCDLMSLWNSKINGETTISNHNEGEYHKPILKSNTALFAMFKRSEVEKITITVQELEYDMILNIKNFFKEEAKKTVELNKEVNKEIYIKYGRKIFQQNQW